MQNRKGCVAMKRINKVALCLIVSLLLVSSAISVYAVNGIIEKKQSEENALKQKEQYVMAILLEEICNIEAGDCSELVSEEYKAKLINELIKQRKNNQMDKDMQFLVDKILGIWPEMINDNIMNGNKKTSNERWELIHQLFIHWPAEVDASDAIKAEIEKHMIEEEAFQSDADTEDVLPSEESIRKGQKEKQKLLEGVSNNTPSGISEDILPTAESIKESQEEKEKLIGDAMQTVHHVVKDILPSEEQAKKSKEEKQKLLEEGLKNIPISNDVPPNEASIKKNIEEKQKSLEESKESEAKSADLPPTGESIKKSQDEKQMQIDESIENEVKSADLPPTEDSIRMSLEEKQASMNEN